MEILAKKLRNRLSEYRYARIGKVVSIHVDSVEMALCLVEFYIETKRPIDKQEEMWFNGAYWVGEIFEGSEWEDLYHMYEEMCVKIKEQNYFR